MSANKSNAVIMVSIAAGLPFAVYLMFRFFPQFDPSWSSGVGHFYIVTFTSLVAAVSASFMYLVIGNRSVEALFLTLSFAMMASIFFIHGSATPGIIIEGFNFAVGWAARLSLTIGAL